MTPELLGALLTGASVFVLAVGAWLWAGRDLFWEVWKGDDY
jgi:hypothetical protein